MTGRDDIIDSFAPAIGRLESETDTIEDQAFVARAENSQELVRRIHVARTDIVRLARLLGGKGNVLRVFVKRCREDCDVMPGAEMELYFGDLQDHVATMTNSLSHFEGVISRAQANYLAQLSIDSFDQGDRVMRFLTRITVVGAVFLAVYFICVLFGMNVAVPWQDGENINAFLGITGAMALFALFCFGLSRWIGLL